MPTTEKFVSRCNEIGIEYISHREIEGRKYAWLITYNCTRHGKSEMTWNSLRKVKGCKQCSIESVVESRKVPFDKVRSEFEKKGYILLDTEYKNSITPLRYICPHHPNKSLKISYNSIQKGHGCKACYHDNQTKYTHEDVLKKFNEINHVFVKYERINGTQCVQFICPLFKNEIQTKTIGNLLRNDGCIKCRGSKLSEIFRSDFDEVKEVFDGKGFLLIDDNYINNTVPMRFICLTHLELGIQSSTFANVKYKSGCKGCANESIAEGKTKDNDVFLQEVYQLVGAEYTFQEPYLKSDKKILVKHNECDFVYPVTPANFLRGRRCPNCKKSNGEKEIANFLDKYEIEYEREFRIKECRNIFPLPFDFAIFKEKKLHCLIEYQGELHYEPTEHFGGLEGFKKRKFNDQIKKEYCNENNIQLIEIPYWDFDNIEKILLERLSELYDCYDSSL